MSPTINIVNVGSATTESIVNVTEIHYGLNFSSDEDEDEFGIFSIKFSTDGQELVAATSDSLICVYDLGADKLRLRIPAHTSDVNTVCFADESGNIIYSGSDDSFCKILFTLALNWAPLTDLLFPPFTRKTRLHGEGIHTLISTGQKYIYAGSSDSSIYIYDLVSGAQVAKLDHHEAPVRDCSWHPFYPMIISSAWDGEIVRWEFPGSDEAPAPPNRRVGRTRRRGFYYM